MRRQRFGKIGIAVLTAAAFLAAVVPARAAELVMFEQAGCPWCEAFDREIAPVYAKTDEGRAAPLRRVDICGPLPADLAFIKVERLTPLFVLVDNGREVGRIRGYPGDLHFWGLLDTLISRIKPDATQPDRAEIIPSHAFD